MKQKLILIGLLVSFFGSPLHSEGEFLSESKKAETIESLFADIEKKYRDAPYLSVKDVLDIKNQVTVIFVDVRSKKERKVSMIPGALTKREFEKRKKYMTLLTIVVYCTIGDRSAKYTEKLNKKEFQAFNLKGGILAWTHAHQGLEDEFGPTNKLHVYGEQWNLAADSYETVW